MMKHIDAVVGYIEKLSAYDERGKGLWYLATPYTKYALGQKQAYIDASAIAGALLKRGIPVFCPIAHSHPIAVYGKCDALDHGTWLPLDEHMMKAARGLIVAEMPGWNESHGVDFEIDWFDRHDKPVLHLDVANLMPPIGPAPAHKTAIYGGRRCGKKAAADVWATAIALGEQQTATVVKTAAVGTSEAIGADPDFVAKQSAERKNHPLASGVLDYFPDALMEVAAVSKAGNDKHNPGQPLHHARGKSTDHADCILRHLKDRGKRDPENGRRHSGETAWRALALLQEEIEQEKIAAGARPEDVVARGARLPCADTEAQKHVEGDYPTGSAHPYFPFGG